MIKNKSYGRAQQHIRQGIIEDLDILLPDIERQKEIVKIFKEIEFLKDKSRIMREKIDGLFDSILLKKIKTE
jgi:restriction endonuclease S subunit